MKFDYVIGNPPYQEETANTSDKPVYNRFMDAVYEVSDRVELITPARFLFNAGKTPKSWNKKMLSDPHLKVLWYTSDSGKVFPNTRIQGGVVVTYRNKDMDFSPIEIFTAYDELNSILQKVKNASDFENIDLYVYSSMSYHITDALHRDYPNAKNQLSKGHIYDIPSSAFTCLPDIFLKGKPDDGHDYLLIWGLENNKRTTRYIRSDYIIGPQNLHSWKIFAPKSCGTGGGVIKSSGSSPIIGYPILAEPNTVHTQTFLSIGNFQTEHEAQNAMKYIKTRFFRTMIGILKATQDNPPSVWHYAPTQNFCDSTYIDWTASVAEIDQQLYKKYGLDEKEIEFIESHVKEMK